MKLLKLAATFTLLASVNAFGWTGWHPTAWDTPRLASPEVVRVQAVTNGPFVFTNYLPQWNQVVDGVYTNYVYGWPPDGSCSTNKVISTNAFLSDIVANAGALDTGAVVNTWSFDLNDCTGGAYTVTRTVTNYPAFTNLHLQARDVWAFDSYMAAHERGTVMPTNTLEKPRYYRNNRDALVQTKQWIEAYAGNFAETNWSANMPDYLTNALPTYDAVTLAVSIGAPSNYTAHTPWRWLGPVDGGLSNVVRGSWAMVGRYDTNGVALVQTNVTLDSCGNTITNVGAYTNGQVVAFVCTNAAILAGHTESDYGWRKIQAAFSNLVVVQYDGAYAGVSTSKSARIQPEIDFTGLPYEGDVFNAFYPVWNSYADGTWAEYDSAQTGLVFGVFAEMVTELDVNLNYADIVWTGRYSSALSPAVVLGSSNLVTIAAVSASAYTYAPTYIPCEPPDSDPCSARNARPPGMSGMLFDESSTCFTNTIAEKTALGSYSNNVAVYQWNNAYPRGNVLTFAPSITTPQNPAAREAAPSDFTLYQECIGQWDFTWGEYGAANYEIPKIVVRWNFERK